MAQDLTPLHNTLKHIFDKKNKSAAADFVNNSANKFDLQWLISGALPGIEKLDLTLLNLIYFYAEYRNKRPGNIHDPYLHTDLLLDGLSENTKLQEALQNKQKVDDELKVLTGIIKLQTEAQNKQEVDDERITLNENIEHQKALQKEQEATEAELIRLTILAIFDDIAQQEFAAADLVNARLEVIEKEINDLNQALKDRATEYKEEEKEAIKLSLQNQVEQLNITIEGFKKEKAELETLKKAIHLKATVNLKTVKKYTNKLFNHYYDDNYLVVNKKTYAKLLSNIKKPESALFTSQAPYNHEYYILDGLTPEFKKIIKRRKTTKKILKAVLSVLAKIFAFGTALTLSVLIAPHIALPFYAILLLIGYGTYKTNYKFYVTDGYTIIKDLFINKLSDLSTSQKIGFGVLSVAFCSIAGLAMGTFSWIYLIPGLAMIAALHAIPPVGLIVIASIILGAILIMTALLLMKGAKAFVTSSFYKEKYEKLKNLWTVEADQSLSAKIWAYTKATVLTALLLGGAVIGAIGVAVAYGQHWFQAFLAPVHWVITHIAPHFQHIDTLTKIGAAVLAYVLATPMKLVFNANYASALFVELGKKIFRIIEKIHTNFSATSQSVADTFKSPAAFKNTVINLAEKMMAPIQNLDNMSAYSVLIKVRDFVSTVHNFLSAISNVLAKLALAGNNLVAKIATGTHEAAKGAENIGVPLVNNIASAALPQPTAKIEVQNNSQSAKEKPKLLSTFFHKSNDGNKKEFPVHRSAVCLTQLKLG